MREGSGLVQLRKDDVEMLLAQLGERLDAKGVQAEIYVVGGAAMLLAYNSDRATADIDAILLPSEVVLEEASLMAVELGLPDDWLNDKVKVSMPHLPDSAPREVFKAPGISVQVASPEYLLGMKATASRMSLRDKTDAALLCRQLGIDTTDKLIDVIARSTGTPVRLEPRRWYLEEIVVESARLALPGLSKTRVAVAHGSCGEWLPRAARFCRLPDGHKGQHR